MYEIAKHQNIRNTNSTKCRITKSKFTTTLTVGVFLSEKLNLGRFYFFHLFFDKDKRKIAIKLLTDTEADEDFFVIRGNRPSQNQFTITLADKKLGIEKGIYETSPILGENGLPDGFEVQF